MVDSRVIRASDRIQGQAPEGTQLPQESSSDEFPVQPGSGQAEAFENQAPEAEAPPTDPPSPAAVLEDIASRFRAQEEAARHEVATVAAV